MVDHLILAVAPNEGIWAGALLALLTGIGGGAWKLLSDSTTRVDVSAREQRDRLTSELDRTREDLASCKAELAVSHAETDRWQQMYLDCRTGGLPPEEPI